MFPFFIVVLSYYKIHIGHSFILSLNLAAVLAVKLFLYEFVGGF